MKEWRRPEWFDGSPTSLWQGALLTPLSVSARLYGIAAWTHRQLFDRGLRRRSWLSCGVVSIGNLVVGGSGKTPTAAWLAAELRRRGHKVALASRGYGRRGREPVRIVSDGRFVHASVEDVGDEPLLLAAHAAGVSVLVGPNRAVVGLRAIAALGVDVLVCDDAFQHHRLGRDVDLVVFDGAGGLGNGRCLPRGPLREPLGAVSRADALFVIDGPLRPEDGQRIRRRARTAPWFAGRRRPVGVRSVRGGPLAPAESLAGVELGLLAGIARPANLRRSVEALGARVVAERNFPDHHAYRPADLADLEREASLWLTTEKDALKILPGWVESVDLRVLVIELEVSGAEAFLDWLEARLRASRR